MTSTHPSWVTAFLDLAPTAPPTVVDFWAAVTGYRPSANRGEDGEFLTLLSKEGADHLRMQRLRSGPSRIHLDLHVTDPRAAADEAGELGATEVADRGYVVMRSPGGLPFCFVAHPAGPLADPAPPATWPGGHSSAVDQVCLDIPAAAYDDELAFWQRLTGWAEHPSEGHDEFRRLDPPAGQPLRLLLQRLGDETGEVRAHLDLAATDRAAETDRHEALGAQVLHVRRGWTVLADPAGSSYCITDRRPRTRVPAGGGAN